MASPPVVPKLALRRVATTGGDVRPATTREIRSVSTSRERPHAKGRASERELSSSSSRDFFSLVSPRLRRPSSGEKVNTKELMDRIEKLESFSNDLSRDVLELVLLVAKEAGKERPMDDEETKIRIQQKCVLLQEFCIRNKPAKSWAAPTELKSVLKTADRKYVYYHHYNLLLENLKVIEEPKKSKREKSRRMFILNEILSTERDYLKDLAVLIGFYEMPLKHELSGLVALWDVHTLFTNAQNLFATNIALYKRLVDEFGKPEDRQKISDVFLDLMEKLQDYNKYCVSREIAQETMNRLLRENEEFNALCNAVRKIPESRNLQFESFMIAPFQRITRYPLLLKELKKCIPVHSKEAKALDVVIHQLGGVMKEANETQKTVEQFLQNMDVHLRFHPNAKYPMLGQLYKHKLLKHGAIKHLDMSAQIRKAVLWVFEEIVVLSIPRGDKQFPTNVFRVRYCWAVDIASKKIRKIEV